MALRWEYILEKNVLKICNNILWQNNYKYTFVQSKTTNDCISLCGCCSAYKCLLEVFIVFFCPSSCHIWLSF